MIYVASLLIMAGVTVLAVFLFVRTERFGALPQGDRAERIRRSAQYKNGQFQNASATPDLTEGASFFSVTKDFVLNNSKRAMPSRKIVANKIPFDKLPSEDLLIWFGHSSYYLQVDGKRILVDPVMGGNASPLSFTTRSFEGTDVYHPDDFPPIDYLFITHDHWDHLDHRTVKQLKEKVNQVITGLGCGAHLERWGYNADKIVELDWNEHFSGNGLEIDAVPARHFSGRGLRRNQVLWTSFVIATPRRRILIGGDSGYDTHFKEIGDRFGPLDLAILECGQYNKSWKFIHLMPEDVINAAFDLKARRVLPVHWGKFVLALHDWDEPIRRVVAEGARLGMPVLHPMIGEPVLLDVETKNSRWWEAYQ